MNLRSCSSSSTQAFVWFLCQSILRAVSQAQLEDKMQTLPSDSVHDGGISTGSVQDLQWTSID